MPELSPGMLVTPTVKLTRPLGAGGMGSVWVADHLALKTEVVVKFMSKELAANEDAVARFSREAAAASQVKSPHVVQTFDHGVTADGVPYIVMELLEGSDLAKLLERRGKLPPAEVAALYTQVAKALGKAHAVGIVHRDIKPDNIFLCDADAGELFVKVLDFGIAKGDARLGSGTTTGQVIGTPYYMSPEQIVGRRSMDLRADIWSLGVVAFELLTGKRPFEGESIGALTLAIHGPTPVPSMVDPSLPPAFDAWFAKACALAPDARFASARDAARALVDALGTDVLLPVAPPSLVDTGNDALVNTRPRAPTLLSSAQPIDVSLIQPPRSRLPWMVAALVLIAAAIGAGAVFMHGGTGSTRAAAQLPAGVVAIPSGAGASSSDHGGGEHPAATSEPAVATAATTTTTTTAPSSAPATTRTPTRPAAAVASPVNGKKTTAAPTATARPAPPRGSDDDIK